MKKALALILALAMVCGFAACGKSKTEEPKYDPSQKAEGVMTYAQYCEAKTGDAVVIEAYVQAAESWWDNKISLFAQDPDGGYFIYNMTCSEEDSKNLTPGAKIRVEGTKDEWQGEIRVGAGASFTLEEGSWIAQAEDMTALLGTDELITKQNQIAAFKELTVESAARYKYDGSGMRGDDLYFTASANGKTCTFMVESYLCSKKTAVYKDVEALKPGEKINLEGFVFWFEEANPNITKVEIITQEKKNESQ